MIKRFLIISGLMILTTWIAYLHLGRPPLGVDDAHIFFVYGQNLAAGEGLVYNPGGERVEGYSSLLWVMVVAGAFALFNQPEIWLLFISILMVAGAITALWQFIAGTKQFTLRGLLFVAWVFSAPGFVIWMSLTLMDTALWSSLLVIGTVIALQANRPRRLALIVLLVLLARPEGMLWGLVLIGLAGLLTVTQEGIASAWRTIRLALMIYALGLGGLVAWRMAYFGYPLPNTYYAKMLPDVGYNLRAGLEYLHDFLLANPQVIFIGLIPAITGIVLNVSWFLRVLRKPSVTATNRLRGRFLAVSIICLVALFVPVWMGGDHFTLFRFYQPVWPLLLLPFFGLLDTLPLSLPNRMRYGLAVPTLVAFLVIPTPRWWQSTYRELIAFEFTFAEEGEIIGTTLNALFKDDPPSIGVIIAGGIALTYEGDVVDVMGLNNVVMAHAPGNRYGVIKNHTAFNTDVFLAQRPNLFLPITGAPESILQQGRHTYNWQNDLVHDVLNDPRFLNLYTLAIISDADHYILAYVDRDYLAKLVERGIRVEVIDDPQEN
jgi:arabinofuranosyltransferase